MACSADINVSQGSVATNARCAGIFNIHLTTNLPRNLPVKMRTTPGSDAAAAAAAAAADGGGGGGDDVNW